MSNIAPIRPEIAIDNPIRAAIIQTVAECFDRMVADGVEPTVILFAVATSTGECRTGWFYDANQATWLGSMVLHHAAFCITRDLITNKAASDNDTVPPSAA